MRFRLIYEGELQATQRTAIGSQRDKRAQLKHAVRAQLHPQLKRLWEVHPYLSTHRSYPNDYGIDQEESSRLPRDEKGRAAIADIVAIKHTFLGKSFVPLVRREWRLACELSVLFLRPGRPGSLWGAAGDLDNRIKTLVDALRMPRQENEMPGYEAHEPDGALYCLMEDDDLITGLSVETDRLLEDRAESEHHVKAIITVNVNPTVITWFNLGLA